jgi:hypothetical protein
MTVSIVRRTVTAGSVVLLGAGAASAQPPTLPDPIAEFHSSYETFAPHAFGPLPDQTVLRLRSTQPPSHVVLAGLPADADIDAYEWLGENLVWFSLADWAVLPIRPTSCSGTGAATPRSSTSSRAVEPPDSISTPST